MHQPGKELKPQHTLVEGSTAALSNIQGGSTKDEKVIIEHDGLDSLGVDTFNSISIDSARHEGDGPDLERSTPPEEPIIRVARRHRRGLFAQLALVPEVIEPKNYGVGIKWFITFVVAVAAAAAPMGSAIIFPSLSQVTEEFDCPPVVTNLTVALYMLSMAIFPLWWSAFSETAGRRTVYLISFAIFIVFSVLSAVSTSAAMLVVFRTMAGGAAASVQAVGAGTIADIWQPFQRGQAMSWFYLGPLCGPLLSPVVGGALAQRLGWRATQYAMAVYGLLVWIFLLFALPETLKATKDLIQETEETLSATRTPSTQTSAAQGMQKQSLKWVKVAKAIFIDPLRIIRYLRFPPVLLTVYYASVTFCSLYILNVSIQYTFEKEPYLFSTLIVGLLYLSNSLGYFLASILGGRWMDAIMAREAVKANRIQPDGKLIYRAEDRMRENAWLGAVLYPAALIWYGWTAEKGVFWLVPMIANFFYGVGSMLIFAMATTMLTEFMPKSSSSGVALNNLVRNIFSCIGGIVGAPVIAAIGNGWLFTILGIWALSSCTVIWAMRRFGPKWRLDMDKHM